MTEFRMVEAYCVKCRAKWEIKDPKCVTMKNGQPAVKGTCPKCGAGMYRIGKLDSPNNINEHPQKPENQGIPYSIDDIIKEGCFLEKSELETMIYILKTKKNLILQGPPGTGKTWLAKKLAHAFIGYKPQESGFEVRAVQFHPNLSYEDFVRGWRPVNNEGQSSLELVDGPFLKMIEDAKDYQDESNNKFVMVIEEINRGNPASIFGEMLTLLEADKRNPDEALILSYPRVDDYDYDVDDVVAENVIDDDYDDEDYDVDEDYDDENELVYIPENMYVIGTMNVADRSIAMMDLALRRRFGFYNLKPIFNKAWKDWVHDQWGIDIKTLDDIGKRLEELNHTIEQDTLLGPHFKVGHSYVTPNYEVDNPKEWFKQIVHSDIGPLLDEYWVEDPKKAKSEKDKLLRGFDS
ncbi:MAG: AAA family ATPase [Thaumarchaeota archaeon]|nr:AAA family ATPase [Nitrososphaerota archaeon]